MELTKLTSAGTSADLKSAPSIRFATYRSGLTRAECLAGSIGVLSLYSRRVRSRNFWHAVPLENQPPYHDRHISLESVDKTDFFSASAVVDQQAGWYPMITRRPRESRAIGSFTNDSHCQAAISLACERRVRVPAWDLPARFHRRRGLFEGR